jgi:hypothetical protein
LARKQRRKFKRLRVMAEYGSSGIWAAEPVGPFRHGMIGTAQLGLPSDLAARFERWMEWYWRRLDDNFDTSAFNTEGLALSRLLKRHVGSDTEVVFAPESEEGGLLPEQVIGDEPGSSAAGGK